MVAKIKATGEIVDVTRIVEKYVVTNDPRAIIFEKDEFDFDIEDDPDYWTRLEHQAAIAAMQAQMAPDCLDSPEGVACTAYAYAHALVEKLKEKEEK